MTKMLKIFTIDNPQEEKILRNKSETLSIDQILDPEFQEFLDNLLYTAKNSKEQVGYDSLGIAAPQVGKNVRAFYAMNTQSNEFELFINPEIKYKGNKQIIATEACLSVPNKEGDISRFNKIQIKYLDRDGKEHKSNYSGWNAIEIQHEYDHLDGVLFIDRVID